jgi:hypothetical protein
VKRKALIKLIRIRALERGILKVHLVEGKRHKKCFVGKSQTSIGRHKEISDIDLMTREYVAQKTNVQPFDFDLTYDFTTPEPNSFEPNKFEKLALKIRRVLNF